MLVVIVFSATWVVPATIDVGSIDSSFSGASSFMKVSRRSVCTRPDAVALGEICTSEGVVAASSIGADVGGFDGLMSIDKVLAVEEDARVTPMIGCVQAVAC